MVACIDPATRSVGAHGRGHSSLCEQRVRVVWMCASRGVCCCSPTARALLQDANVVFAGYIVRHPLDTSVHIKIQTVKKDYTPRQVCVYVCGCVCVFVCVAVSGIWWTTASWRTATRLQSWRELVFVAAGDAQFPLQLHRHPPLPCPAPPPVRDAACSALLRRTPKAFDTAVKKVREHTADVRKAFQVCARRIAPYRTISTPTLHDLFAPPPLPHTQ
jgi:hypothetical protein